MKPLVDNFGRLHDNLRISVTDRCNIRCFYCMPEVDAKFVARSEILSFEEIERFVRVAAGMGVRKLRITGGEPLVRKDVPKLIEKLVQVPGIEDIGMTTNAVLLADHAKALYAAGLRRLNVHLDTLDRARFEKITRRDDFPKVMAGIDAAQAAGFERIKINAVAVKDLVEDDIVPLARFGRERGIEIRYIEFMPLDSQGLWLHGKVLLQDDMLKMLTSEIGPLEEIPDRDPRAPASEFRFKNRPLPRNSIFFAVSQSGETADTLGALREARRKGYRCLGICNNVGSTIARESDGGMYMHAGPEIGVAATKSFVSQVALFGLLTLTLGRMRHMSASTGHMIIQAFEKLPDQVRRILSTEDHIAAIAQKYAHVHSMLFLGRQYNYPIALEAALKLKEISYIHAAGFPASELKHGIIALIDPQTPTVVICPQDSLYEKNISTMQEIRARKGPIIAVATEGDEEIHHHADDVIYVPRTVEMLQPILNIIPLQLLSYHAALTLGRDVDKPRNLAKSVTVE